jgi:phosphoribosylformylglycinamidine synthase
MGERTPLAVIDGPASGRMAVAEALTNLAAAPVDALDRVKLSANWMAAAGAPGEDAALFDTVRAVALELCPALGVAIPVGKDSMSMRTRWDEDGRTGDVVGPLSLIVSAFASCADVRGTWTPQLRTDLGPTAVLFVDLAGGRMRLGGSILAQVFGQVGHEAPDLDDPSRLRALYSALGELRAGGLVLAYHDRSDGGLFVALAEMAFAGHTGLAIDASSAPDAGAGLLAWLFAEELGVVLQVRDADLARVHDVLRTHGLRGEVVAAPSTDDQLTVRRGTDPPAFRAARVDLHRAWSETTWQMQLRRDNPALALQEYDRLLDAADPGISPVLTFDPAADVAAPFIATGARPKVAILREQGVNGQVEMAAAFTRAGFDAYDVHMSDLADGRVSLAGFAGYAACGGFSYGDVLGGGGGWAKSVLFNRRVRDDFERFFARPDSFALGVCNGCQMMAELKSLIPGAAHWPRFLKNASEQFEARFVTMEIVDSPSLFFRGMAGSRIPVAVAHGEGQATFDRADDAGRVIVAARYVDNYGRPTSTYPLNPNGSPDALTALTTADGRFTILMPHPERVFRTVQMSWHPDGWGEDSPWMRIFRNARVAIG